MTTPNDALKQAQQDVPAAPSTAPDDTQTDTSDGSDSPAPDAGNKSGQEPKDGKSGGRNIDNVRGELLRKMETDNSGLRSELAEVKGMLQGLSQVQPVNPAAPNQRGLQDMSSEQLTALLPQATDEQKPQLQQLIQSRMVDERATAVVDQRLGQREFDQQRTNANQQAYARFPDLHNTTGTFYRETNKVLDEMGKTATGSPRAVLDAANEAGVRLGLSPKAGSILLHQHDVTGQVGGRSAPAPEGKKQFGLTKDRRDVIAKRLKGAMPKGEFSKDNLASIDTNSALYDEHRDNFIKK